MGARVWHLHPPKARPQKAKRSAAKAKSVAPVLQVPAEESAQALVHPVTSRLAALPLASAPPSASPQVVSPSARPTAPPPSVLPVPVPERAPVHRTPKRAKPQPDAEPSWSPWPRRSEPDTAVTGSAAEPGPAPRRRPAWMISPRPSGAPDVSALEVAHDSDPGVRGLSEPHAPFAPASWPSPHASLLPLLRPTPEPARSPKPARSRRPARSRSGPFPEAGPFREAGPVPEPGAAHGPEPATSPEQAAGTEPATSAEYAAPPRPEPATGSIRRLRSGLVAA